LEAGETVVSIQRDRFLINGSPTYSEVPGVEEKVLGRLINFRAVQAIFDDANPATRPNWCYPDGSEFDPDRQTDEFIGLLPEYYRHGIRAITINLQGGGPKGGQFTREQQWVNTGLTPTGYLKPDYVDRLDRVLSAADRNGMVVILGIFYFGQDQRIRDEAAVVRAVSETVRFLVEADYRNVLIEIANECDLGYDHDILKPKRVHELLRQVQSESDGKLPVSVSFRGGKMPSDNVILNADFILLHGNGQSPRRIRRMVARIKEKTSTKPIVFNEDSVSMENFAAAFEAGASWGYYDQGENNYIDGFQSPPTNWTINTDAKRAFFNRTAELIGIK
jgi:hypothetical protein